MRARPVALAVVAVATLALAVPAVAGPALGPAPYHDPPFHCRVYDYGTARPPVPGPRDDPLCVAYDKRNITLADGGILRFAAAEPGRFAIVAGKCAYWQVDRWSVQAMPGGPALVSWRGSYWYDAGRGQVAAVLRSFEVAGRPVGGTAFLAVLARISPQLARQLAPYADPRGGGGMSFSFPAVPGCA